MRKMQAMILRNPRISGKKLKAKVPGLQNVSVRTIQRWCQVRLELPARKPAKKPKITEAMKEKRLRFAMKYRDWSVEQWKNVMWSDESNFEVMRDKKMKTIRKPKGSNRHEEKYCKQTASIRIK